MTLTQAGIDYICQNFGDENLCCINTGLSWYYTLGGDDYPETGGTAQIVGRLASGIIDSLTMTYPPRETYTQTELNTANGGTVTIMDAQIIADHDEPHEDQWCYTLLEGEADVHTVNFNPSNPLPGEPIFISWYITNLSSMQDDFWFKLYVNYSLTWEYDFSLSGSETKSWGLNFPDGFQSNATFSIDAGHYENSTQILDDTSGIITIPIGEYQDCTNPEGTHGQRICGDPAHGQDSTHEYQCNDGTWIDNGWTSECDLAEPCTDPSGGHGSTRCVGLDRYVCNDGEWVLDMENAPECIAPPPPEIPWELLIAAGIGAGLLAVGVILGKRKKKQ